MKPDVLFIIDSFEQGGSERQALQLLRQLRQTGECRVHLACLQDRGSLRGEAEELNIGEIHEYPLTSFYNLNYARQLRRLVSYLKEKQIDVVHAHCFYTNIFGMTAAFLAGVPARITSKGETGLRTPMQNMVERISFRLAHRVIANCMVVQNQLISEGVNPKRIIQHYNGLDLERLKAGEGLTRAAALAQLGLPQNDRRFVTIVANLRNPVKNYPMFLRAAARVRAAVPDAAFVIAGEGQLMPSLQRLASELGIAEDVNFIGRCDDVASLLFASNVGVLSSKSEGFANAILEYMAAGLPVVATNVGGACEAIIEGETGYIVPNDDDEKMAERIIQVLANDEAARVMGARGKARAAEKFSSDLHLQKTLELYKELLSAPGVSLGRRTRPTVDQGTGLDTKRNEFALKPHRN